MTVSSSRESHRTGAEGLRIRRTVDADPAWESLLVQDPAADFFHTRAWTEAAAADIPGTEAVWLTAYLDERPVGGLAALSAPGRIHRVQSSLEGTSGGPIVSTDLASARAAAVFRELVAAFLALRSGPLASASLVLNVGHEERFGPILSADPKWVRRDTPAAVIDLSGGLDHVEREAMQKAKRNERNRALRRGVEVFPTNDPAYLQEYYPLYLQATRWWGVAPTPLPFLQRLLAAPAADADDGRVAGAFFTCVRLDGCVIGGHLNLHYGDRVVVWNGVTDPAWARTHFPATAAVWGDLQEACRRGARWLDLGGSGGVVSLGGFKRHFGAVEEKRGWYLADKPVLRFLQRIRSGLNAGRDRRRRLHESAAGSASR